MSNEPNVENCQDRTRISVKTCEGRAGCSCWRCKHKVAMRIELHDVEICGDCGGPGCRHCNWGGEVSVRPIVLSVTCACGIVWETDDEDDEIEFTQVECTCGRNLKNFADRVLEKAVKRWMARGDE